MRTRRRGSLLVMVLGVVLLVSACGRATEEEINQALGITPSPTMSSDQMATGTAAAVAQATARAAAVGSPGAGGQAAGDVTRGNRTFTTWCLACHGPAAVNGPKLLEPGGPGAAVTADSLLPLIREGTGHAVPPGPYTATEISDTAVVDLAAFIRSRAAP